MKPVRADFLRSFFRSFALQGSWNFRGYQSGGLVYSLLPLLRRIHAGDPVRLRRSLQRHLQMFNGHPYLGSLAVGALARLEHESTDPEKVDRAREAMSASLGAFGDQLVWSGWRPICLLCGVLAYTLGAGPWTAALVFLIPYNLGHVVLRLWAFRRGWEDGPQALRAMSDSPLRALGRRLPGVVSGLAGASVVGAALWVAGWGGGLPAPTSVAAWAAAGGATLAAVLGYFLPRAGGRAAVPVLVVSLVAAALLG